MIEVQKVDDLTYLVRLDAELIWTIGWGCPAALIRDALARELREAYPLVVGSSDDDVPF